MFDVHVTKWAIHGDASTVECIERSAAAGADGVELLGWENFDVEEAAAAAAEHGVDVVSTGATGAAMNGGAEGPSLTDPDCHDQAVADIERALAETEPLGVDTMVVTVGLDLPDYDRETQHDAIVSVLRDAAPAAEDAGVTLVVEPLNTAVNHEGYYLTHSAEGFDVVDEVDSPNVKLLYDVYHQQITEGNLVQTIRENVDAIGEFHVADVPGRHEPGTGEIDYEFVLGAIADAGYEGSVGLEYVPTGDPDQTVADVVATRDAL